MTPDTHQQQPFPQRRRPPRPPAGNQKGSGRFFRILLGMSCLGVVLGLSFVFVMAFILLMFWPQPMIASGQGAVLQLVVQGNIAEYQPPSPWQFLLDRSSPQMHEFTGMIKMAAADENIEGILLDLGPTNLSWAQTEELRSALVKFRQKGKWIVAYGEGFNEQDYLLASVANEIYMIPEGILEIDGLATGTTYYADLLARYGVSVHVEAVGEFKSMADGYRYNQATEPVKRATQALLDNREKSFINQVADTRNLEPGDVKALLDRALYSAADGKNAGLVDKLLYRSEVEDLLRQKCEGRIQMLTWENWWQSDQGLENDSVAVLYASGTINSGGSGQGMFGDVVLGSADFVNMLRQVRADPKIKAVVIRIDSPGGGVLASDVIWQEIKRVSEEKPVIASMGSVAASGGYYLAMACDHIMALPNTITGSIGIVTMRMDFSQLYEAFAVNVDITKTSPQADFWENSRPLTPGEKQGLEDRTLQAYQSFVTKAASCRKLEYNDMDRAARGRPWSGSDALDLKLIDSLGGLDDAIIMAAEQANLSSYSVIRYPNENHWDLLNQGLISGESGQLLSSVGKLLPPELRFLGDVLDRRQKINVLAISPFSIKFQ